MGNRVFFAVRQVGFAVDGSMSFTAAHGVQDLGTTTTFNLEQVFELGQSQVYESIEGIPEIEMTMSKVMDGYPQLYHLMTMGAPTSTLFGRSGKKATVAMSIFDDTLDSASGVPTTQVIVSGAVITNLEYDFPVDGNFTESITAAANNRVWRTALFTFSGAFPSNNDTPWSSSGSGGVNRREDMLFTPTVSSVDVNGQISDPNCTVLPGGTNHIPGINVSGVNQLTGGVFGAHIQNINVSAGMDREDVFELGRKAPYFRFLNPQVQVTTSIEVLTTQGDMISATEDGVAGNGSNLSDRSIRIATREGLRLNLGTKNKLNSVTEGGGGTDGSNLTVTYEYINFNSLDSKHMFDPTTYLRP